MNFRMVFNQLGLLLIVLSASLGVIWLGSLASLKLWDRAAETHAPWAFLLSAAFGLILGGLLWLGTRSGPRQLGRREALLLVSLSWMVGAAVSAMPFFIWAVLSGQARQGHPFGSFIDCYFEAMSGLTTTGSTVLSDIESLPPSILLWRSLTQWLGGLGIVVLFVAVLPTLGVGGKKLFRVEAPGPSQEGVRPQIRQTARILWLIYLALTLAEIGALWLIGRMSLFDSICHTFTTLATGGYSTQNTSIGAYDSTVINTIVIVFMVLAGINFALYFALLRRKLTGVYRDTELRFYLFLLLGASAIVVGSIMITGSPIVLTTGQEIEPTFANALREGVFTTVSCQTTTGFCTSDFNQWAFPAKVILLLMMVIGGSGGSTAGGTKVIRIWILLRVMVSELERVFRPQVVRPLKIGNTVIDDDLKLGTMTYVLGIVFLMGLGALLLMEFERVFNPSAEIDFTTAATASIATLFNIGPGLNKVGAIENFGWFSWQSKCVMCLLMALGRLEMFAILVLFTPRFWRGN